MARNPKLMQKRGGKSAGTRGRGLHSPDPAGMVEYFILDPNMREFAGKRLEQGQRTIRCTAKEAAFHLANGALSTEDPEKNKSAKVAAGHLAGELSKDEQAVADRARKNQTRALDK